MSCQVLEAIKTLENKKKFTPAQRYDMLMRVTSISHTQNSLQSQSSSLSDYSDLAISPTLSVRNGHTGPSIVESGSPCSLPSSIDHTMCNPSSSTPPRNLFRTLFRHGTSSDEEKQKNTDGLSLGISRTCTPPDHSLGDSMV